MTSAAPLIIIQEDNSYKIDIKFDKEKKLIKNYEYINIIFNVFNLKGNVEKIKIQLNKKEYAQDIKFKKIMNHINDLIKENNNFKIKIRTSTK